jgi:gamma-glutamyltranspeptidase/glutathione hydrolase
MAEFTTRPEILGSFGVITSTHWIASSVGMAILERGGNAFDAAVAAGFVLQIVEPHLCGPGGDMPAIIYSTTSRKLEIICGQAPAPAAATIQHYRSVGLGMIPGNGLLATVIPGAFDGWMLMLREHGTMSIRDVLEPAIYYAEHGHPILPAASRAIDDLADFFKTEWRTSFETWLPSGSVPAPHSNFRNPVLAETWKRVVSEAMAAGHGREHQIDAARDAFYRGFIAETIDAYLRSAEVMDGSGFRNRGVLSAQDMAGWQATIEQPQTYDYANWTVAKTGAWGQGPVLLQSLALLKSMDIAAMDPCGPDFVHSVVETMKLAYADREVYYGDPDFCDVPLGTLLSDDYNMGRRALIKEDASYEFRPGVVPTYERQVDLTLAILDEIGGTGAVYEPTMAHLSKPPGDTVHLDVIDRWGNMVSATPSGGWLQSSPVIPGLGFALNSRAQMFWLKPGHPTSLEPGKRPRTTLTPSMALRDGRPVLAFGTPGGDQQDQWQLAFFLRHVHHQKNLQSVIDMPMFHTAHFPASFHPRTRSPGEVIVEGNFDAATLEELRRRGHSLTMAEPWSVGRLTAASRDADGLLRAAASPRLMQAYAIGR